ncbi:hypothetical protein TNCV_444551 [Trichonephila clavipes]|nr:hypothetical protein TNCV_444551 [Trichonephila clavipes]
MRSLIACFVRSRTSTLKPDSTDYDVAGKNNTRAEDGGLHNFEPRPNGEDDTRGGTPLFEFPHRSNGRTLSSDEYQILSTRQIFSGTRARTYETLTMLS